MASPQSDGLDYLLFEMYKKQHLRSKMSPELLRILTALKGGTSDFGFHASRLEDFLASMVAGEVGHSCAVSDSYLCGLKSRLESMFGSLLSKENAGSAAGFSSFQGVSFCRESILLRWKCPSAQRRLCPMKLSAFFKVAQANLSELLSEPDVPIGACSRPQFPPFLHRFCTSPCHQNRV